MPINRLCQRAGCGKHLNNYVDRFCSSECKTIVYSYEKKLARATAALDQQAINAATAAELDELGKTHCICPNDCEGSCGKPPIDMRKLAQRVQRRLKAEKKAAAA